MLPALLALALSAQAESFDDPKAYEQRYVTTSGTADQRAIIRRCLDAWHEHPFDLDDLRFRVMETNVRVFGAGAAPRDDAQTAWPQLVLVKPAVSVMTGTTYHLLNPNGWYCFDATVSVLASTTIKAQCTAKLADSRGSLAVLGANESGQKGGVTVLGKLELERVGCD